MTQHPSENTSKSNTLKNMVVVIFSVLFTLVLLEIAAQIWFEKFATKGQVKKFGLYTQVPENQWKITRHHYLNYTLSPNYRDRYARHNSLGYRGEEFSVEKPDSIFRIVAIGGSTTYTIRVNNDKNTYTAQLEKILKEDYGYDEVEVINAGVPGYNSWESLMNLQFRVLDLNPDLVLIYHGTNDVHTRMVPKDSYHGDNRGKRKDWNYPKISIYDQSALLRVLRRRLGVTSQIGLESCVSRFYPYNKQKMLDANPPIYFERNLKSMVAIAQQHDVGVALATWAYTDEFDDYASTAAYLQGFKENNDVVIKVGNDCEIPVFDFEAVMPKAKEYWGDGRHVNKKGARLKAELFAKHIHEEGLIEN